MKITPLLSRDEAPVALTDRLESGIMPLINLVFLLLMFFLIAGVIAEDQLPELPGNNATRDQQEPRIDFSIDETGQLLQEGLPVDLQQLPERIGADERVAGDDSRQWRLGAHRDLAMADLERVLAAFNKAGVEQVQLLTEPSP